MLFSIGSLTFLNNCFIPLLSSQTPFLPHPHSQLMIMFLFSLGKMNQQVSSHWLPQAHLPTSRHWHSPNNDFPHVPIGELFVLPSRDILSTNALDPISLWLFKNITPSILPFPPTSLFFSFRDNSHHYVNTLLFLPFKKKTLLNQAP